MLLADILSRNKAAHKAGSVHAPAIAGNPKHGEKTIDFEMDLHLPCRIAGAGKAGSRWEGEAMTLSLSSFGAHILLPVEAELEGGISIVFNIPSPLRSLFLKRRFRIKAEIKPSGAAVPGVRVMGRKVVFAVFSKPLRFRS